MTGRSGNAYAEGFKAGERTGRMAAHAEMSQPVPVAQCSWMPIETAPKDIEVLMGWWSTWPERFWETSAGLAGSTKGGWLHGQATHWMPCPSPPVSSTGREFPTDPNDPKYKMVGRGDAHTSPNSRGK